jgi:hypothetical protein
MMCEDNYLLDEFYKGIDLIVSSHRDDGETFKILIESSYPTDEKRCSQLIEKYENKKRGKYEK